MIEGEEHSSSWVAAAEPYGYMNPHTAMRKRKIKNRRRFSDDQIRSLESIFESESRLEPRKKVQLARDLGLQPRQIAVWFQNKRARYKSKQIEKDYSTLQANYNNLATEFEAVKKEKQALLIQLQKLNDLLCKSQEGNQCCKQELAMNSIDRESDTGDTAKCESEANPSSSMERSEQGRGVFSDEDSGMKAEYLGLEEEANLMSMVEAVDGSSSRSHEDWGNLETSDLFDQPGSSYQWWDFWS